MPHVKDENFETLDYQASQDRGALRQKQASIAARMRG
jgi:hypothetical protein